MQPQDKARYLATFVAVFLFAPAALAATIEGTVVSVTDGDTFTLQNGEGDEVLVRLAEIDAPEGGQPYSLESRDALTALIDGKDVRVKIYSTDQYDRKVGRVFVGDLDVVAEMVRIGAAWVYRDYVVDRSLYATEKEAKAAQRGLWSTDEAAATPPWEWVSQSR